MALRNVQSAAIGATLGDRLASERDAELIDLLRANATTIEHAAMSLALEDAKTALDLCSVLESMPSSTEKASTNGASS
jgi:hypothetical protein